MLARLASPFSNLSNSLAKYANINSQATHTTALSLSICIYISFSLSKVLFLVEVSSILLRFLLNRIKLQLEIRLRDKA